MSSISPALSTSWTAAVVVPYMLPEMSLGPELQNFTDLADIYAQKAKRQKLGLFNGGKS